MENLSNISIKLLNKDIASIIINEPKTYNALSLKNLADLIRAFKKLEKVLYISREMAKKPHKNIILKGKSAQEEINNVSSKIIYRYKLERSITDKNSKIIIFDVV